MSGATHQKPSLRANIESMTARGIRASMISRRLGCDLSYAEKIASASAGSGKDQSMPDEEANAFHVARALVEGGFPTACIIQGQTVRLGPFGQPWKHLRRRRGS